MHAHRLNCGACHRDNAIARRQHIRRLNIVDEPDALKQFYKLKTNVNLARVQTVSR